MTNETNPRPNRGAAARRLLVATLAAAGLGWAAASHASIGAALSPAQPGRLAPYTLQRPAAESAEREIAFHQARVRANPDGFLDLVSLAQAYLRRARATGDPSWHLLAEQAANRSLASFSGDNPGAWLVLTRVAIARHDFRRARALADTVLRDHPRDPGALSALVTVALATGDLAKAAPAADALVAAVPGTDSYTQRALVNEARGRDTAAQADFERAIALEQPGQLEASAMARAWLGRLHARQNRLDDAQDLYREALRIVPNQPVVLSLAGELALVREDHKAAADRFGQAFAGDPNPAYLMGQAQAMARAGDGARATELTNRAEAMLRRDLAASSFGHRRDLARLLLERGRRGDAAEALRLMTAEAAIRQDTETKRLLAWARARAGRPADADRGV